MKRALPLLLLVLALSGVAISLLNSGGSDSGLELEAPALAQQSGASEAESLPLSTSEELGSLPQKAQRLDAGTDTPDSAGMAGVETRTYQGGLSLPYGSPQDPTLRVVAISIEWDEEQAFIAELKELGETDPEAMRQLAEEYRERNETEPYEGRPYDKVEVNPDGSFSFEVTAAAESVELRLDGRYLYLEEMFVEEVEEDRIYELEPTLGACLSMRITLPIGADADERVEALERIQVALRGSESGGMMGMVRSAEQVDMEHLGDGLFEARSLPTSLFWLGGVESPDYVDARTNTTKLEPGEDHEISVILEMGARLSGVTVTERGEPVKDAEVSVRATNDTRFWMGGGRGQNAKSDEEGHFELRGIPAGEVRLSGSFDGSKNPEPIELEIGESDVRGGYELVFGDGLAIRGVVFWSDGAPVSGARVGLETGDRPQTQRWGRSAEQLWVTTDEAGAFALTGLEPGSYRVRANQDSPEGGEALGRWRGVKEDVTAGTSGIELRLEEPAVVKGRVLKTDGTPLKAKEMGKISVTLSTVSESEASIKSAHGSIYRRGDVEEDGTFRINGIYPAEYNVSLDSDKFVHAEPDQKHIHPGAELIVRVSLGASITGVVLDPNGGPVENCEVTASTSEESNRGRWGGGGGSPDDVRTGEGGVFAFEGLKEGKYKLTADSDEWARNLPVEVQVAEGQEIADVTVQLLQGGTIIGTVFGEDGQPVAGRSVMVSQGGFMGMGGNMGGEETTDASGRFLVEHVTPGSYQVMTQPTMEEIGEVFGDGEREPGFADFMSLIETVSVEVADGETVEVVLGAPPAAPVVVSGRVLEGDQTITTGSVLAVADGQGFMQGSETARIGSDGRYEMTLDAAGDFVFLVQGAGDGFGGFGVDFPVTIPEVERFEFDLTMPASEITGVVYSPDGTPQSRVGVSLQPSGAGMGMGGVSGMRYETSAEDGSFAFKRLRAGSYVVQAGGREWNDKPTGAVSVTVTISEDEGADVRLELQEAGTIEGIVLGQDGAPLEGATVFFRFGGGTVQTSRQPVMSGGDGKFRNNGLSPGAVTVVARTGSGSTKESAPVMVRSGDISTVELILEEGTLLRCVCEDSAGDPIRASVSVVDEDGREQTGLRTREQWMEVFTGGGEQRETRVGPVPPGKYEVIFTTDDGDTARRVLRLTGRPERKVRVRIRD